MEHWPELVFQLYIQQAITMFHQDSSLWCCEQMAHLDLEPWEPAVGFSHGGLP